MTCRGDVAFRTKMTIATHPPAACDAFAPQCTIFFLQPDLQELFLAQVGHYFAPARVQRHTSTRVGLEHHYVWQVLDLLGLARLG